MWRVNSHLYSILYNGAMKTLLYRNRAKPHQTIYFSYFDTTASSGRNIVPTCRY